MIAFLLALWCTWAVEPVAAPADPDQIEAALVQVDLWLDLGELGQALALSRRGVRKLPEDPRWHLTRIRVLHRAGLGAWIEAEYGTAKGRSAAATEALTRFEAELGEAPGAPVDLGALLVRANESEDASDTTPLLPFAPLFEGKADRATGRAREAVLGRVDTRIASAEVPLSLLRAAELCLAIDDRPRLEAIAARLRLLRGGQASVQDRFDGFTAGPAGWTAWDVPLRPRWGGTMLDEVGKLVARQGRTDLPWGRADELRRMAVAAAEAYTAAGNAEAADRVVAEWLGGCGASRRAEAMARSGRGAEGRALAEERLLHCVGGTDLFPTEDPVGLDLDAQFKRAASAWLDFGRVADLGGSTGDAAMAYSISARLAPEADVLALARRRAREAGLLVDGSGLPSATALVEAMDARSWLTPAQALQASRARLGKARLAAMLSPTPARLLARITPDDLCVPTLRERCMLERAVAAEAHRRAGLPVPEAVASIGDAGALRAAPAWLDALDQAWFQRTASLHRLSVDASDAQAIARILDGETGVVVGRAAPAWSTAGFDGASLRGRVVVLSFWASWCRPCFAELPVLDALAQRWEAEGVEVRVLAVNVDKDESAYRRGLGRLDWQAMNVLRDEGLRRVFGVEELPSTFVIDPSGVLREAHVGYDGSGLDWLDRSVRTWAQLGKR